MSMPDHQAAYDALTEKLMSEISNVHSRDSARRFARESAKHVRRQKQRVPEFYEGEFVSLFKDALIERLDAERQTAERAGDDAKMEAQVASVELTARLEAADAAGDRDARHDIWKEREALQRAVQNKIDSTTAELGVISTKLDAFKRLALALDVELS